MDEEVIYKTIAQQLAKKKASLAKSPSNQGVVARTLRRPWLFTLAVVAAAIVAIATIKLALTH